VRIGGHVTDPDVVEGVNLFIVLFFFVLFVTALVLTVTGLQVIEALVASVVHLVNVGPGFGSVASVGNCHDLGGFSKFVLSLAMIMGRIELFGFFILFSARK
jgi:trk system potassium uptake protein TrkH